VDCEDEASREWLTKVLVELKHPVIVAPVGELLKLKKIFWISGIPQQPDEIVKIIKIQNPNLKKGDWMFRDKKEKV